MTAPGASTHAEDRRDQPTWLVVALVVATGACAAMAGQAMAIRNDATPAYGSLIGFGLSSLAVLGLPSLSVRLVARVIAVCAGLLLVRFGVLSGTLLGGDQLLLVWVVGAISVFVLTDRIGAGLGRPFRGADDVDRPEPATTARAVLVVVAVIVLLALLFTPSVLSHVSETARAGDGPRRSGGGEDGSGSGMLRSTDRLDMTQRPKLTDEVVFTVDADRGTFWRGETFDLWDGQAWTRSQPSRYLVNDSGTIYPAPDDLAVNGPEEFRQTFHIEASYADVLFSASSPVQVDSPVTLAQRFDGTLSTANAPLGRGATYTVTSRRQQLSPEVLRADTGTVPSGITARYAASPTTTERVRRAALAATAGKTNTFDKILALQAWMGRRTKYSLDAPLSPEGVDVVDHFLFESRLGWCEQVASSLVVMARANGIPARLVTGYVPEDRDRVTGRYLVRSRDAHAWAEVWFPSVGWVPFDPTADVPLAGKPADDTLAEWVRDHIVAILLVAAAVALVAWGTARFLRRRREARARRPVGWAAEASVALDRLGERVDRPRQPWETATAYAAVLADAYDASELVEVGRLLDDELFAPDDHNRADQRARADVVLAALAVADAPEVPAEPVPT